MISDFFHLKDSAGPIALVHGGAWNIPQNEWEAHESGVRQALEVVQGAFQSGKSALQAVTEAVARMELNGAFDAGCGSVLNRDGFVELDAGVMDGSRHAFGSVSGITNYPSPIRIARRILEHGERQFCFLAGSGRRVVLLACRDSNRLSRPP